VSHNCAYAVLAIKGIDAAARTISGIASTPNRDRHGDIFEPAGATFANPIPLLFHHDTQRPIGQATLTKTAAGIAFTATLPTIDTPGVLRDRVDEAWHAIAAGLMRGVSIGFRVLEDGIAGLKSGRNHYKKTEIIELSLVTVPANLDATILTVKSLDEPHLAALGIIPSGAPDPLPVVRVKVALSMNKTVTEQITAFEATRAAKSARMADLMSKAADEGVTLDAAQTEEYDGFERDVTSIDAHLVRLRAFERTQVAAAAPVVPATRPLVAPIPIVQVRSMLPKGTGFTRVAMAIAASQGNPMLAVEYAKQWDDSTPEVGLYLKAAVAPGSTTDPAWAGALVATQNIQNEFIELLRPATIIGRIPGLRMVPFNASVPVQTAGGAYGWVGQAKPKPVTKLGFGTAKLEMSKAAGIIVLTEELVRSSSPSAEAICRADMIAGIAAFLDMQFIDPAVAYVAGVNPASITNGIAPIAASSPIDPLKDIQKLLGALAAANIPLGGTVLIMSETNALALGFARDALGNKLFPSVGVTGGSVEGISIITSNAAGTNIIALAPSTVLVADDGGVTVDVSREASIQMDSAPMSPSDATTVYVSMFQNNLVALRAERFVNWKRGRDEAVKYVSGATYTPTVAEDEPAPPTRSRDRDRAA
jgi:HK97 family phage major capsid protein/HK97 family phage prohead protease